jgi:hypothetical protein
MLPKHGGDTSCYFGDSARHTFFAAFKGLAQERYKRGDMDQSSQLNTARQQYLNNVVERQLLPLPVMIRPAAEPIINLQGRGLGDEKAIQFAECLSTVPDVQGLNLCDNRLTDQSLVPLIKAVQAKPALVSKTGFSLFCFVVTRVLFAFMKTHLDLSRNKFDMAGARELGELMVVDDALILLFYVAFLSTFAHHALATYLRCRQCTLCTVVLSHSDLDDQEIRHVIEAMEDNRYPTSQHTSQLDAYWYS